ncbi:MAG: ABC transporter permease [Clostridia bacterium]|nr:ABC transporter permease [Clostridia bacterium]
MAFVSFLSNAIKLSASFLYGSTGEIITEKSGHLNLGIPGVMSVGAAIGCMTVFKLMKAKIYSAALLVLLPFLTTIVAGGLMGLLYSFMTVTLRANQNVTGLALTTLGVGLAGHFMNGIRAEVGIIARASQFYSNLFQIKSTNWFVQIFLSHGFLVYLALIIAIGTQLILNRTRIGLHLRAVGENPATADAAGVNVTAYKYVATIVGSAVAALGGLFTIMDYMGGNWEYLLEGFGWLSIALVIFTLWRPALAIPGSIIFGGLYIAAGFIKGITFSQIELIKMLPYVMTIVVLIFTSIVGSKKAQPPASLGLNYFREER